MDFITCKVSDSQEIPLALPFIVNTLFSLFFVPNETFFPWWGNSSLCLLVSIEVVLAYKQSEV
jgi:hypothetical protein